jgi:hypothetical protein
MGTAPNPVVLSFRGSVAASGWSWLVWWLALGFWLVGFGFLVGWLFGWLAFSLVGRFLESVCRLDNWLAGV